MQAYPTARLSCGRGLSHRFLLPLILLLLAVLLPAHWVSAKDTATKPGQIVFLPFTVTTQPPQEHLRTGLTNILATRLSERTGLTAVPCPYKGTRQR